MPSYFGYSKWSLPSMDVLLSWPIAKMDCNLPKFQFESRKWDVCIKLQMTRISDLSTWKQEALSIRRPAGELSLKLFSSFIWPRQPTTCTTESHPLYLLKRILNNNHRNNQIHCTRLATCGHYFLNLADSEDTHPFILFLVENHHFAATIDRTRRSSLRAFFNVDLNNTYLPTPPSASTHQKHVDSSLWEPAVW